MDKAIQREIKKIRGNYSDKMLVVANPNFGKAFEQEVHMPINFFLTGNSCFFFYILQIECSRLIIIRRSISIPAKILNMI